MPSYTSDLPATPEQLKALGMVAAEWSYLESIVVTAIWHVAYVNDEDEVGRAITKHTRISERLRLLRKHFRLQRPGDKEGVKQLDELCSEIVPAGHKRNELVHAELRLKRDGPGPDQ